MTVPVLVLLAAGAGFWFGRLWQWVKDARAQMGTPTRKKGPHK